MKETVSTSIMVAKIKRIAGSRVGSGLSRPILGQDLSMSANSLR